MLRLSVLATALLVLAPEALAQRSLADSARVLTVSGFGRAVTDADRAVLRIMFETEGETIDEAIDKHEAEVERVRTLLREAGVPDGEVKLERSSVGPAGGGVRFESVRPDDGDESFRASRTLVARVDDLDSVSRLMAEVSRNDGDDLLDIQRRNVTVSYTVRDIDALDDEALQDAVRRARARAELIAEMGGFELGEIVTIGEGGTSAGGSGFESLMMMAMMGQMGGESGMADGEFVANAAVTVTFRIR